MNQHEACTTYIPLILRAGAVYEKSAAVEARPAVPGEVVITETRDGVETRNTAKAGDYVLRNGTVAAEQYILSGKKLATRYLLLEPAAGGGWAKYKATGECSAVRYDGQDASFVAAWGEEMVLKHGDFLCIPLPAADEVYRIAAAEFGETYRLKLLSRNDG